MDKVEITIEIIFITAQQTIIRKSCVLREGALVRDALSQSDFYRCCPEAEALPFGIFSKPATLDTILNEGDRIEFYRPLLLDPKEKRRLKAKAKKKLQKR